MADGHDMGERAKFREMLEGTKEDWDIIVDHSKSFNKGLAKRVLDHLRLLDLINHQHAIGEEKVTEGADQIFLIERFEVFLR